MDEFIVPTPDARVRGLRAGDFVRKVGGDYTFEGEIVAAFEKISGAERYVVEDDRGVLHVYSAKNLAAIMPLLQRIHTLEAVEARGYTDYVTRGGEQPLAEWSARYFDHHDTLCRLLRLL